MNKRHKAVLALSLAVAGLALLNGGKLSEALGIILVGTSLTYLIGSQFMLARAMFVWKHRIRFATIATLGIGGVYGWARYGAYKTEKQAAAFQACMSRNSQFFNADAACERDPSVTLQPQDEYSTPLPQGAAVGAPQTGDNMMTDLQGNRVPIPQGASVGAPQTDEYSTPLPNGASIQQGKTGSPHSSSGSSSRRVRTLSETELTTTEYGSLTCGHIRTGETALLLVDAGDNVKIRTAEGQIGWAGSSHFEVLFGK